MQSTSNLWWTKCYLLQAIHPELWFPPKKYHSTHTPYKQPPSSTPQGYNQQTNSIQWQYQVVGRLSEMVLAYFTFVYKNENYRRLNYD